VGFGEADGSLSDAGAYGNECRPTVFGAAGAQTRLNESLTPPAGRVAG
jgi:hypothetical protein